MQKVMHLRKKFPDFGLKEIFTLFFKEEWDSLIVSFLVLCTYQLFLFIIEMAEVVMPAWWDKYLLDYVLAVVMGYAGQRLAYKYLGTAEKVLTEKAEINKP
jgi:hypothetical protein